MAAIKKLVAFLFNVVALAGVLAVLAGAAWGAWQIMPEASRNAIRNPGGTLGAAERGARSGPTNPLTSFGNWLQELVGDIAASRRDTVDTVRTADGTPGGIVPLPGWATLDESRVFGTTETFWQSRRAKLSGARWSRVVFFWSDIQPGGPRDWRAGHYLRDKIIEGERRNGIELVGLLMNTPPWAASRHSDGVRAVPSGLNLPVDHPQNYWAAFVRKMAADYRGRIDTWIVWNEPDIKPGGPNAQYYSWAGSDEDYALLLRTAQQAAKLGNPNARIVFASTTYWADANANQPLFLERVLSVLAQQPDAGARGPYFDAVGLNLYTAPDDLLRVAGVYRQVLARYGLSTPLWLTETNAVPYDDPGQGLTRDQNGLRVTMDQQASFVVQAYAMGLAAGYQRIAIHSMMDRDTNDELWGLVRNDGTMRPAFVAYQTAARYLGGARRAVFAGRERPTWRWPREGYVPNWHLYLVAIERPPAPGLTPTVQPTPTVAPATGGVQRVSVVWNGDAEPRRVAIPRTSERATIVDKYGRLAPMEDDGERWVLTLPGATAHSSLDPDGYFFIGGDPLLLIEDGAPEGAPVLPPEPVA